MPPQPPSKGPAPKQPAAPSKSKSAPRVGVALPSLPSITPVASPTGEMGLGVAVEAGSGAGGGGTVTVRKAGGLRDLALQVDPDVIGVKGALQHLAKAVNIAFQTEFGENELESVYQAAVVRYSEIIIVHKEYFGFRDTWFSQFGKLLRSLKLTLKGPDPASPEGQRRFAEKGPSSIRGILNLVGRKLDLVAEYENRVPVYVEQMFDRLEATGIIEGWDRDDWVIRTTKIGLDIRIAPAEKGAKGAKA